MAHSGTFGKTFHDNSHRDIRSIISIIHLHVNIKLLLLYVNVLKHHNNHRFEKHIYSRSTEESFKFNA